MPAGAAPLPVAPKPPGVVELTDSIVPPRIKTVTLRATSPVRTLITEALVSASGSCAGTPGRCAPRVERLKSAITDEVMNHRTREAYPTPLDRKSVVQG